MNSNVGGGNLLPADGSSPELSCMAVEVNCIYSSPLLIGVAGYEHLTGEEQRNIDDSYAGYLIYISS